MESIAPCFIKAIVSLDEPVRIPIVFVSKYIKEQFRTDALLQGREGKIWTVKIEVGGSFGEGWKQFARYHDLEVGFVLIFFHQGDMLFLVKVVDRTTCERQYPHMIKIEEDELSPQPQDVPNTTYRGETSSGCINEQNYPYFTIKIGSSYLHKVVYLPAPFARTNQLYERLNAEVILIDPLGNKLRGFKFSSTARLSIKNGWCKYARTQDLQEGSSVTFWLTRNT